MTQVAEVGKTYRGTVAKLMDFGAFITLFPGTDGLLHISKIAEERVENVSDYLKEGEKITVKVNTIDDRGKIDLDRHELEDKVDTRAERSGGGRGDGVRGGRNGPRRGPRDGGGRGGSGR